MCSISESDVPSPIHKNNQKLDGKDKTLCVKCGVKGILVTRIQDTFCKDCFQVYVVHKFRAAIGKSKLIRDGEKVLVAFSGGANSAALLHLIKDGLSERAHKKLRFIPTILHIDETCLLDISNEHKKQMTEDISKLIINSGFQGYITSLEQSIKQTRNFEKDKLNDVESQALLCPVDSYSYNTGTNDKLAENLKAFVSNLASFSSKEDAISNLRIQLMVFVARQLGFDKILTAECSTRLGVKVLTDVSIGRGGQIALNTKFSDTRNGDVMFIRPVRDLNAKELTMYNNIFNVSSVFVPCITTKGTNSTSIERLTEAFVTGLQADYQSTVSNIVRTSEKLGVSDKKCSKCVVCQSQLDTEAKSASALSAVEFSLKLSENKAKNNGVTDNDDCKPDDEGCCGKGDGGCKDTAQSLPSLKDINKYICYGCRLSFRDFKGTVENFPSFVTQDVMKTSARNKMREEIADFLIEDCDDDL